MPLPLRLGLGGEEEAFRADDLTASRRPMRPSVLSRLSTDGVGRESYHAESDGIRVSANPDADSPDQFTAPKPHPNDPIWENPKAYFQDERSYAAWAKRNAADHPRFLSRNIQRRQWEQKNAEWQRMLRQKGYSEEDIANAAASGQLGALVKHATVTGIKTSAEKSLEAQKEAAKNWVRDIDPVTGQTYVRKFNPATGLEDRTNLKQDGFALYEPKSKAWEGEVDSENWVDDMGRPVPKGAKWAMNRNQFGAAEGITYDYKPPEARTGYEWSSEGKKINWTETYDPQTKSWKRQYQPVEGVTGERIGKPPEKIAEDEEKGRKEQIDNDKKVANNAFWAFASPGIDKRAKEIEDEIEKLHQFTGPERPVLKLRDLKTRLANLNKNRETARKKYYEQVGKLVELGVDEGDLPHRTAGDPLGEYATEGQEEVVQPEAPVPPDAKAPAASAPKDLTRDEALSILKEAGGDKNKARELARQRNYKF